jgi:hypothetical protein
MHKCPTSRLLYRGCLLSPSTFLWSCLRSCLLLRDSRCPVLPSPGLEVLGGRGSWGLRRGREEEAGASIRSCGRPSALRPSAACRAAAGVRGTAGGGSKLQTATARRATSPAPTPVSCHRREPVFHNRSSNRSSYMALDRAASPHPRRWARNTLWRMAIEKRFLYFFSLL